MIKIKLILVDDELTGRDTIKKFLDENDTYEIVADFSKGKPALEWLRKNDADIILCDMQMPEMNGVELMRNIHVINEYLPLIAISGFDSFDYVRGSLVNGAANYLLKHELTKEKLIRVLDQVREKYRIVPEGKMGSPKAGYCITVTEEFSEFQIREKIEKGMIEFGYYNVVPIAIGADFKFSKGVNPLEYKQDICKAIIEMLNQMLKEKYKYLIYFTNRNHILLLVSFEKECSTLLMFNVINNLISRLQRQMMRMLGVTATIVNGEVHRELKSAIQEAAYLQSLLEDKLYLGGNRIVLVPNTKKFVYGQEKIPENLWNQLEFELQADVSGCYEIITDILSLAEKIKLDRKRVVEVYCRIINYLEMYGLLTSKEKEEVKTRLEEYEIFEQFRTDILEIYDRKIKKTERNEGYSSLIKKVIELIQKNYSKDISLEECAQLTGSSYSYLSREFKKETGMRL